jgi:hypothetical protein
MMREAKNCQICWLVVSVVAIDVMNLHFWLSAHTASMLVDQEQL